MDVSLYLRQKGFNYREVSRPSGRQAVFNCPFCNDKDSSFAISLGDGAYKCFRENNCGVKGSFTDFQRAMGDEPKKNYDKYVTHVKKNYKKPDNKGFTKDDQMYSFFESRKISRKTVDDFNIRIKGNAVCFPYTQGGELVAVKYRDIKEKKFWGEKEQKPILWNMDNVKDHILYITEGEMDCMALYEYGITGVSVPNGVNNLEWIETCWEWLDNFKQIYLVFDMDSAGEEGVDRIVARLGRWRCYRSELPFKDVNECLMNGVSQDDFISHILKAREFGYDCVRSAASYRDDLVKMMEDKDNLHGVPIHSKGLQDILKGWRMGEWTVWAGSDSCGKTTFMNMVAMGLVEKGEKVCIASMEMKPERLLRWMVMQHSGYAQIDTTMIDETIKVLSDKLFLIGIYNTVKHSLLSDIMKYVAQKYGVRHFIVDNLTAIDFGSGNREYEGQKEFVTNINAFVQDHNNHVHLVTHPRKGEKDSDRPDKVSIHGSGAVSKLAYNVITFYRPTPEQEEDARENGVELPSLIATVRKNREWGRFGSVKYKFVESNKRFVEV